MTIQQNQLNGRQGVALILVLGFLAVLTIMAVAFAINMRTERLTTRVYLDSVRARQLVDVGLARALNDLNQSLVTNKLFAMTNFYLYSRSPSSMHATNLLADALVREYLPASLPSASTSSFITVYSDPANPTQAIGRVAYLAVNLTGLLDVNHVGRSARNKGQNPGEIQIVTNLIPELEDGNSWGLLSGSLFADWGRIDTLRELNALAQANDYFKSNTVSFAPFSRSLIERNPDGDPKVNIGGSKADLQTNAPAIRDALGKSGIDPSRVDDVYNQLLDYVDTDLIPENPDGLSGEPVPMINEIMISGSFNQTGDAINGFTYELNDFRVVVEWWFPFAQSGSQFFDVDTDPQFSFRTVAGRVNPEIQRIQAALNPTNGPLPQIVPDDNHQVATRGFYSVEYRYEDKSIFSLSDMPTFFVDLSVDRLGVFYNNTGLVDSVFSLPLVSFEVSANSSASNGLSCLDPRVNHEAEFWDKESTTSIGSINSNLTILTNVEPIGSDPVMYSRNFPLSEEKPLVGVGSVAELGYLSIGEPWKTIALYKAPVGQPDTMHPVLDYFTIAVPDAKTNGLVNMNTLYTNSLNSVFYDMTVQKAPEVEPNLFTNDVNKARELAGALRDLTLTPTNRLSAIGEMSSIFSPSFDAALDNDPAIESIIRNSIGLLTVRDGMYAVVIQSESLSETGDAMATERALAFVWRDPQVIDGVNESIVRYFTWLSE